MDVGLTVHPPIGERPFPDFKKPLPVGFFSVNTERDFEPNDKQLRYFKRPAEWAFPLDLNMGLSLAIKKPLNTREEGLCHLLKFIYDHHKKIFLQGPPPEFVSWRGLLRLIMCAPYEHRDDWCVHVTRFNNVFYMREWETSEKIHKQSRETEVQKKFCAWGFKFEQYCLSQSPQTLPDIMAPVDECAEFSCVYQTRLSGLNLLYGAEMDGIISEQPVQLNYLRPNMDSLKFVELKVRQGKLHSRQYESFLRFKIRNWWCQSFLVGINDLYVGMRNECGLVQKIEHMELRSLPKLEAQKYWTPSTCTNFLFDFLSCIKQSIGNKNCPYTVYEFYFSANTGRIYFKSFPNKNHYSFIPDCYNIASLLDLAVSAAAFYRLNGVKNVATAISLGSFVRGVHEF